MIDDHVPVILLYLIYLNLIKILIFQKPITKNSKLYSIRWELIRVYQNLLVSPWQTELKYSK